MPKCKNTFFNVKAFLLVLHRADNAAAPVKFLVVFRPRTSAKNLRLRSGSPQSLHGRAISGRTACSSRPRIQVTPPSARCDGGVIGGGGQGSRRVDS